MKASAYEKRGADGPIIIGKNIEDEKSKINNTK